MKGGDSSVTLSLPKQSTKKQWNPLPMKYMSQFAKSGAHGSIMFKVQNGC